MNDKVCDVLFAKEKKLQGIEYSLTPEHYFLRKKPNSLPKMTKQMITQDPPSLSLSFPPYN